MGCDCCKIDSPQIYEKCEKLKVFAAKYHKKREYPCDQVTFSGHNPNEFYVFDKFTEKGNILVYLRVVKDPLKIDNIYQLVSYFPCHKANDKELKTFYNILTERELSWDAYNKKLLRGNYMYFYPKNGHYYFRRDTIRCKDRATGEWYDAVLYSDVNG